MGLALLIGAPLGTITACGASEKAVADAAVGDWSCTNESEYGTASGVVTVREDGTFSVSQDLSLEEEGTWSIESGKLTIGINYPLQITTVPTTVTAGDRADLQSIENSETPRDLQVSMDEDGVVTILFGSSDTYPQVATVCERA